MELNAPEAGEKRQRLEKVSEQLGREKAARDAAERSLLGAEGQPARNDKNWVGTPMPSGGQLAGCVSRNVRRSAPI